ncbi:MAG: glutamyl-tRNA reductase [Syntrophomonadaceae bacterium]|nr:glutamyl-tRNA reductase [Syntrophomonadaceae bacterium]
MYILLVGLNHKTAPVEVREKLSICGSDLDSAYQVLMENENLEGVVILATCNRTEIYATTRDVSEGSKALEGFLEKYSGFEHDILQKYLYKPSCYDTIRHLFNVTSGLDSMVLGEAQIISQVKEAYQSAINAGASDGVLNSLFQKAIYVGKKVRTETTIDKHSLSVSSIAVELARQILGELKGRTVMVVGAGEMSELTTRYLMLNGVNSVVVSNRSYEKALRMAEGFNGKAVRFDQMADVLQQVDIVISCTAANHYVIRQDNCRKPLEARNAKEIILIDIAVPRDIEPELQNIPGVFVYDIDDLQNVVETNYMERQKAALEAQKIIDEEINEFNSWLATLYVVPVITSLKNRGETIKENELKRAFNRLGKISDRDKKIISSMAHSIVNQLLHYPIVNLKGMAASNQGHLYAEVVKKLFALQFREELQEYEQYKTGN